MAWIKKIPLIFPCLTFALMIGLAQAQYNPDQYDDDGDAMLERCKSEGAIALVVDLMKNERKEWDEVLQKVAAGNSQWIDASACLSHGVLFSTRALGWDSDYARETLMEAWSAALLANPEDLLRHDKKISLSLMCSFPLYMFDGSVEFADDFLVKALTSLERVEDDYLRASKEACALYLKLDYKRYISYLEEYNKPR